MRGFASIAAPQIFGFSLVFLMNSFRKFFKDRLNRRRLKNLNTPAPSRVPDGIFGLVKHRANGTAYPFSKIQWMARNKATGRYRVLAAAPNPRLCLKANERLIGRHTAPDKLYLTLLARFLSEKLDGSFSKFSFAHRLKRKSGLNQFRALKTFQAQVFGNIALPFVAKIDIRSFFDSIPHLQLTQQLERRHVDADAVSAVRNYLGQLREYWGLDARGLLQGSPLSGLLANLTLDGVDRSLSRKRIRFIRYADDITLLASSEKQLQTGIATVTALLAELGLELNCAKTEYAFFGPGAQPPGFGDSINLLGFRFLKNGDFEIRQSTLQKARQRIEYWTSCDRGAHLKTPAQLIEKINFFLGYEYRPKPCAGKRFRISHQGGWVRYFTKLGASDRLNAQMQAIDSFINHRVKGWLEMHGDDLIVQQSHRKWPKELGSAVGLCRTLTWTSHELHWLSG